MDFVESTLQTLLDYDGLIYTLSCGYWLKFDVRAVEVSKAVPHGVAYSMTLHQPEGTRIMTAKIRSLRNLRNEMRAVARGKTLATVNAAAATYESAEAVHRSAENLLRLLTPENRALMKTIDTEQPTSIDALAIRLGREPGNVSRTLTKLVNQGLVRLVNGPRRAKIPQLVARQVTINLDVCHPIDEIVMQ
jgi:predicted transcriptional regulator